MTPVTSSSLVPTSTSNKSHTRSDELRARSKFTTHESHTRVDELRARSKFATQGRDQQRTSNHRAQRAPQQGAEEKNSTALRYHVCRVSALCPARNFRSRSNQTMGCAHTWMSGRAYESSLSMSRPVYRLKTSATLWQCGWSGTNTPPDEGGQNYLHLASWRSANCALTLSRKCLVDTLKTVRTRPSRSTSAVVNSLPSSPAQARHSDLRTNYKQV